MMVKVWEKYLAPNASWAAIGLALLMSLYGSIRQGSAAEAQSRSDRERMADRIRQLEDADKENVKRREIDDLKSWMKRVDDKLDHLLERGK